MCDSVFDILLYAISIYEYLQFKFQIILEQNFTINNEDAS